MSRKHIELVHTQLTANYEFAFCPPFNSARTPQHCNGARQSFTHSSSYAGFAWEQLAKFAKTGVMPSHESAKLGTQWYNSALKNALCELRADGAFAILRAFGKKHMENLCAICGM